MKDKKYTVVTYGCQMNEHDSEEISWILENMGYVHTDDIEGQRSNAKKNKWNGFW